MGLVVENLFRGNPFSIEAVCGLHTRVFVGFHPEVRR
jgi:hypothetical protein